MLSVFRKKSLKKPVFEPNKQATPTTASAGQPAQRRQRRRASVDRTTEENNVTWPVAHGTTHKSVVGMGEEGASQLEWRAAGLRTDGMGSEVIYPGAYRCLTAPRGADREWGEHRPAVWSACHCDLWWTWTGWWVACVCVWEKGIETAVSEEEIHLSICEHEKSKKPWNE